MRSGSLCAIRESSLTQTSAHNRGRMSRRVILIIADGLRADAVEPGTMPSLFSLGWENTRAREANTVTPSTTVAALVSLATGVSPESHGLLDPGIPSLSTLLRLKPLARELATVRLPTVVVGSGMAPVKETLLWTMLTAAGVQSVQLSGCCAGDTALVAKSMLADFASGLAIVHFKDCDNAGHSHGWMSDRYLEAAAQVDAAIAITAADSDQDLLIVTADHGGGGVDPKDHDTSHPVNIAVPLVLAGRGVSQNQLIERPVSILDIPPTILWTFGLPIQDCYEGRVLVEAFTHLEKRVHAFR